MYSITSLIKLTIENGIDKFQEKMLFKYKSKPLNFM